MTRPPSTVLWPAAEMSATADGDLEAVVTGEGDCQSNIVGIGDADDERGMVVDVATNDHPIVVVIRVGGQDHAAGNPGPQGLDGQPQTYVYRCSIHGPGNRSLEVRRQQSAPGFEHSAVG